MHGGFLYLIAVMDWFSRYVTSRELSNTMETGFCPAALNAAFRFGQPQIWNSDHGSQFTAAEFLAPLKARSIFCPNEGGHLSFVGRHTIVPL
jgi:putative transposase